MDIPIFKYYDVYQIFQRISCATNEDIMLIKEKLANRASKNFEKIKDEFNNINQLKSIIDEYLKGKETTIKNVMLNDFSKELGYILEKNRYSVKKEVKIEDKHWRQNVKKNNRYNRYNRTKKNKENYYNKKIEIKKV